MSFSSLAFPSEKQFVVDKRTPLVVHDTNSVFFIEEGIVELYEVVVSKGEIIESKNFITSFTSGQLYIPSNMEIDGERVLIIDMLPASRLLEWNWSSILKLLENESSTVRTQWLEKVEKWMLHMTQIMVDIPEPQQMTELQDEEEHVVWMESNWYSKNGVRWVCSEKKTIRYLGLHDIGLTEPGIWVPLMPNTWIHSPGDNRLKIKTTEELLLDNSLYSGVTWFQNQLMLLQLKKRNRIQLKYNRRLFLRDRQDDSMLKEAVQRLSAIADKRKQEYLWRDEEKQSPYFLCCQWIAEELGIKVDQEDSIKTEQNVEVMFQKLGVRYRKVALREGWWKEDNGPLFAFWRNGNPVILIPNNGVSYRYQDPEQSGAVNGIVARQFQPFAYELYRPFPDDPFSLSGIISFISTKKNKQDGIKALGLGALVGVLGLAFPWLTGAMIDQFIPLQETGLIIQMFLLMCAIAIATFGIKIYQSITILRMFGISDATLNAAMWDRLLNLPPPFFRRFDAGDLAMRLGGFQQMFQIAGNTLSTGFSTALFSVIQIIMLFFLSRSLAWLSIFLILLYVLIYLAYSRRLLYFTRNEVEQQGKLNGLTIQLLRGMPKLRTSYAERRAFQRWSYEYSIQRDYGYKLRSLRNQILVLNSFYPILSNFLLLWLVSRTNTILSTGEFVIFHGVFSMVIMSIILFCESCLPLLQAAPQYDRLKPLIQEKVEIGTNKLDPGDIKGLIEIQNLSFSYEKEGGTKTLDNVSLIINPGEFVAIVGLSGSGKSTLLRLLIGFEEPLSGSILYDGKDMRELDLRALRKQCGVVLQNGSLFKGSITDNIIGQNSSLTEEAAWEAVEAVGLSEDISNMPMKMNTVLSEFGGTLSGGQRQRIFIARAIVHQPKILFLDEATSALDQISQQKVSQTLDNFQGTRIIIAHRLSTIMNADRIIVLEKGRIVQQGTYEELMKAENMPFYRMASKQVL